MRVRREGEGKDQREWGKGSFFIVCLNEKKIMEICVRDCLSFVTAFNTFKQLLNKIFASVIG